MDEIDDERRLIEYVHLVLRTCYIVSNEHSDSRVSYETTHQLKKIIGGSYSRDERLKNLPEYRRRQSECRALPMRTRDRIC